MPTIKRHAHVSKPVSRSKRAGLMFPVGRISAFLKRGKYAPRVGAGAPVFIAAVLEYLAAEVVDLASSATRAQKKQRITPRHIYLAIKNDLEFSALLPDITITQGGNTPSNLKEPIGAP